MAFAGVVASVATILAAWLWIEREQPVVTLTVGAGPFRSDSYELLRETAEVVARHSRTLRLNVVATRDSSQNITLLNQRQVDLATIRSDTPVISNIRMVAELFPDYFQILTHPESDIRTVGDLTGKRVAIPPFGTDEFRSFWVIGDHYDLPITGIQWLAMPFEKAARQLLAGQVDAVFTVRSLRDRRMIDLIDDASLKHIPLRFVAIDQAEAIAIKRPFLAAGRIPRGTYGGDAPTPPVPTTTATLPRILVTRADIAADPIAELTRILFEHRLDLTIRFALASAIRKPEISNGLSIPLHDGAAQYFDRDEPNFLQQNAEPLALMVTVIAMIISGLFAIRTMFVSRQKNRMDSYNYVLLDIAERSRQSQSHGEVRRLKGEMFSLLETAVRALDTDEVTEEGFQSFSLLWESVREMLNERLTELPAAK